MEEKTLIILSCVQTGAEQQITEITRRIRRAKNVPMARRILLSTQDWVATCQSIQYLVLDAKGCCDEKSNLFTATALRLSNHRFSQLPNDPYRRRFAVRFNRFLNRIFDLGRHEDPTTKAV